MIYAYLFVMGLVFGSFFLVVGTRLPEEKSIIKPRSHCDNCGHELKWYELIPVFSYLFLGAKCHKCHQRISPLNMLIELFTGTLFLCSYLIYGSSWGTLIMIVSVSVLVIIFVSDFKYFIILDSLVIIGSILLVIINLIQYGIIDTLWLILEAGILFLVVWLIKISGDKVFKKESLGGGDVKLSIFMGLLLGVKLGLISIVLASVIALPYAIIKSKGKEKEVPFGPFLITSAILTFIFQTEILTFIKFLLEI